MRLGPDPRICGDSIARRSTGDRRWRSLTPCCKARQLAKGTRLPPSSGRRKPSGDARRTRGRPHRRCPPGSRRSPPPTPAGAGLTCPLLVLASRRRPRATPPDAAGDAPGGAADAGDSAASARGRTRATAAPPRARRARSRSTSSGSPASGPTTSTARAMSGRCSRPDRAVDGVAGRAAGRRPGRAAAAPAAVVAAERRSDAASSTRPRPRPGEPARPRLRGGRRRRDPRPGRQGRRLNGRGRGCRQSRPEHRRRGRGGGAGSTGPVRVVPDGTGGPPVTMPADAGRAGVQRAGAQALAQGAGRPAQPRVRGPGPVVPVSPVTRSRRKSGARPARSRPGPVIVAVGILGVAVVVALAFTSLRGGLALPGASPAPWRPPARARPPRARSRREPARPRARRRRATPSPTPSPSPSPTPTATASPSPSPSIPAAFAGLKPCPDRPDCYRYRVRPGDSLTGIAAKFGITLAPSRRPTRRSRTRASSTSATSSGSRSRRPARRGRTWLGSCHSINGRTFAGLQPPWIEVGPAGRRPPDRMTAVDAPGSPADGWRPGSPSGAATIVRLATGWQGSPARRRSRDPATAAHTRVAALGRRVRLRQTRRFRH